MANNQHARQWINCETRTVSTMLFGNAIADMYPDKIALEQDGSYSN